MAYIDQITLAKDPTFMKRVTEAAITAALAISNESTTVPGHAYRVRYATYVLGAADVAGPKLTQGVASNPAILAGASDAALLAEVNNIWNAYAGVVL